MGAGPFAASGISPALTAAYGELIGPGRWIPPIDVGHAVAVRFRLRTERTLATTWRAATLAQQASAGGPTSAPGTRAAREEGTAADTEFWRPSALCLPVAQAIVAGHAAAAETSRRYNRMPTELARPASDSVVLCPFTADPADAPPFPARHADRRARRRYRLAA